MRKNRNRIEPAFARAAAYDEREVRGFDRKDSVAALCAILAAGAIVTNALFLQRGPHPAPILVNKPAVRAAAPNMPAPVVASPARPVTAPIETRDVTLPRPNPAKMEAAKSEPARAEPTRAEPARLEPVKAAPVKSEPLPAAKQDAPPRPVRTIPMPEASAPRPPDPIGEIIAPPARRVSAVQRVLSDFGYGQIKPTGNFDRETQDAIEQFERAKKLPVTRQITPVLMRELGVLAGRPLE
ncbi:MAG TPA: peptidoglycan-binding protein [Pseudorhodoplanes sp.]|nr:peptidoglycan-binding protein [Pseudorhodoplanes sp.]